MTHLTSGGSVSASPGRVICSDTHINESMLKAEHESCQSNLNRQIVIFYIDRWTTLRTSRGTSCYVQRPRRHSCDRRSPNRWWTSRRTGAVLAAITAPVPRTSLSPLRRIDRSRYGLELQCVRLTEIIS